MYLGEIEMNTMFCAQKSMKRMISLVVVLAMLFSATGTVWAAETTGPTYQQAYDRMVALQEEYPEGMTWTNTVPYGPGQKLGEHYQWKGGKIDGRNIVSVGCAAFAFILSDAAFGSLPNRTYETGKFKFEDVRVGDVLRVNNNSHVVIVLKTTVGGVIIAEGNYNGTVHWGRAMSKAEVENADLLLTRYPVGYSEEADDDEEASSGKEGSLSWTLTKGGVLTISGNGIIPDYSVNDDEYPSWNAHKEAINTVVIEQGVTGIGGYAFYQYTNLLSVYIPDGVKSIGTSAFQETGLVAVTIPESVTSIGASAFRSCGNLTSVSTSEGLETIGDNAFRACTSLQYIDFPASITTVGAGAFTSCVDMISIRFKPGTGNVTIGDSAFAQCQRLLFVTLPQKLQRISSFMFQSCTMLSAIYIPASVNDIGENPFTGSALQYGGTIYFGGSKSTWNTIGGRLISIAMPNTNIEYNITFEDPFDVEAGSGIVEEEHTHSWSAAWFKDDTHHWHECEAEGCDVTSNSGKGSYGAHSYGAWVVDVKEKEKKDGSRHRDCEECGYRQTESIPAMPTPSAHTHSWSAAWFKDDTHHWHECEAEGCDVTSNSGKGSYGAHSYGAWVVDVKETAKKDGSRHRDCKVCGYRQTEKIPATPTKKVKVTKLKIMNAPKTLKAGKSKTLKVKVTPASATNKKVTWKSSNKKYATVNSKGKVTAKKAGKGKTVKITATTKDGSKKKVTVKIKIK